MNSKEESHCVLMNCSDKKQPLLPNSTRKTKHSKPYLPEA